MSIIYWNKNGIITRQESHIRYLKMFGLFFNLNTWADTGPFQYLKVGRAQAKAHLFLTQNQKPIQKIPNPSPSHRSAFSTHLH